MNMNSHLSRWALAAIALCSATFASLPVHASEIICYEYLTISGSSQTAGVYLLTDYVPKSNTVVRARYASSSAASSNANQFLFCSRLKAAATEDALNFGYAVNANGKFRFDYYASQTLAASSFTKDRDYELLVSGGKAYVKDDTTGSVVEIGDGLRPFVPQYKLALFQSYTYSNGSYTLGSNSFHGKFYYLAIYDIENGEEVLKHYFVPCLDGGVVKLCDVADSYATSALTITGGGSAAVGGKERETIGADSYVVAENGTITLDTPSIYAQLVNAATECIFDQTGDSASMENAHSFTGFTSYVGAGTFFRGGWWDFGAGNLGSAADSASNHHAEFSDGAFVTNVANVHVAGTSGTNNQLRLTGASSLYAGSFILGSEAVKGGQKSKVTVSDGSLLHVSGELSLSTGEKFRGAREQTGNSLTVSGAGSRLVVGGQTALGRDRDATDSQNMRFGGNTFTVTDGASATLGALNVDTGGAYAGESNKVVFSKNARVTMTSLSFATAGTNGGRGGNLLEIIDGAVVTNTGTMMFGKLDIRKELGNRIVVSNATFNTALKNYANRGYFLVWGHGNTFVMSGADANLTVRDTIHGYFLGNDSMFIMENNASRNTVSSFYTYTSAASGNTVLVRTGATMNCPNGITTVGQANVGLTSSTNNKLVVESGASINTASSKDISIYGKGAMLIVDDGSINCGGEVRIGSTDSYNTNCLAKVCGTHPKATIAKDLTVKNDSALRFELPAAGYDADSATIDNPILDVGATAGKGVFIDETSRLELTGAEEMQAYHKAANLRRTYVLIKSNSGGINLPEGQLETLQAQLPDGMTLNIVTSGNGQMLVLRVSPKCGTIIVVR